jgi:protein phosphatase
VFTLRQPAPPPAATPPESLRPPQPAVNAITSTTSTTSTTTATPDRPLTGVRPAAGPSRLSIGCASSRGRIRDRNEDAFLVQHLRWLSQGEHREAALLVVADGMGGYQAGDKASRMVLESVGNVLSPLLTAQLSGSGDDGAEAAEIDRAINEANEDVFVQATSDPACKGMGATAAIVLIRGGQAFIGHIGDCRVYHHRSGQLTQVTRDQTLVERMIELEQITRERAKKHPARNEVTQAIGRRAEIEPAHHRLELAAGDWLLVCCDGLTAHLETPDLEQLLSEIAPAAPSAHDLARQLVDLADERGGSDNCTVVVASCY